MEDMSKWKDGLYAQNEPCPYCGSINTTVAIHGAIKQWWCQTCDKPFMPESLDIISGLVQSKSL